MRPAMRRAIFDTDSAGDDYPHSADDPLTP
jgi:hypothetical protein